MAENGLKPPATLDCCRVLAYVVLPPSIQYRGSNVYVGGSEIGPVPRLAICDQGPEVLLLHCDDNWKSLAAAGYSSVEQAKAAAERAYPGSARLWVDPQYTEQDARKDLEEIWGDMRCTLCGKMPFESDDRYVGRNGKRICESCLKSCVELLKEDEQPS